jgi:hypothetical protein
MAVSPSRKFAYVPDAEANVIFGFTIDSATGALVETAGSPFAGGAGPTTLATVKIPQ